MTTYCEKKLRVKIYFETFPWSKYTYHFRTEGVHNEPAIQWNGPTCNHKSILPYKIELVKEHKITHSLSKQSPKHYISTFLLLHILSQTRMKWWGDLLWQMHRVADSDVKCTQKWKVQMEFLAEAWWWQNFMIVSSYANDIKSSKADRWGSLYFSPHIFIFQILWSLLSYSQNVITSFRHHIFSNMLCMCNLHIVFHVKRTKFTARNNTAAKKHLTYRWSNHLSQE